jgi:aspartyl-tRNA(Asn)/glutamyl-tRNA(Gln) amidotransferase subunit B
MTLVDLNRAGIPLIEIVSEPDLESSEEAHEYLARLKETLRFAGVSECDMEKGSLRCDVNVSVHRDGEPWGTRIELKNLNSFKNVVAALEHEVARQIGEREAGRRLRQETRLWDVERGETRPMRSKETEDDYRYFLDPDLPPMALSAEDVDRALAALPELPAERRARWQAELGLSGYDAGVLSASRALADFFEETARLSQAPKEAANWLANDVAAALASARLETPGDLGLTPERLAELIALVSQDSLSRSGAKRVFAAMLTSGAAPGRLVEELGLAQVSDAREIEAWCRAALKGQARAAADVRAGELKALGALIGKVMKASDGRANPELVRATLLRLIKSPLA